jgi:hypothetical protein
MIELYAFFQRPRFKKLKFLCYMGDMSYAFVRLRAVFRGGIAVKIKILENPFKPLFHINRTREANSTPIFIQKFEKKFVSH